MLMPKFSLRQALWALSSIAILLTFLGAAWRGSIYATAIISGFFVSIVPVLVMAGIYWVAYGIARLFNRTSLILFVLFFHFQASNQATAKQQIRDSGQAPFGMIPAGMKGFDIEIESVGDASNGFGYSTIWVTIRRNPAVPRTEDEPFLVTLGPRYGDNSADVARSAAIPAGKSAVRVEMFCPLPSQSYLELSVFRGSKQDIRNRVFNNFYFSVTVTDTDYSSIWIDSKANVAPPHKYGSWRGNTVRHPVSGMSPDPTQSSDWPFPGSLISPNGARAGFNAPAVVASVPNQVNSIHRPAAVNPKLLSPDWIGITSIDLVFIRQDELNRMKKERPELCLMLDRWTSVGGTLVVFDLKNSPDSKSSANDWRNVDEILPTILGDAKIEEIGKLKTVWLEPSSELKSLRSSDSSDSNPSQIWNNGQVYTLSPEEVTIAAMSPAKRWIAHQLEPSGKIKVDKETKFLVTTHVKGRIIAVQADFKQWKDEDWVALRNSIHATRGPVGRTFMSAYGSSNRILAIPGIGEPPLQVFQVLVGLFVLLAGPGVYWVLKSSDKLQLFFIVVPLLSLLTSLSLFGYITIADGFESYGRVQSVTWVDHPTRSSTTSANATYYHNRRPKTYEHPYGEVPVNNGFNFFQADQSLEVSGRQIAPRTQHRFENVTSQSMEGYLKLISADDPNSKPMIRNKMGAKVRWVAFRTYSGWMVGENIDDEQTIVAQELTSREMEDVLGNLNSVVSQLSPDQRVITAGDRYQYYFGYDSGDQKQDLIERLRLADLKYLEEKIDEGGYLAVMERFPHVEKQLQNVIFKNQLHVVVGRW